MSKPSHRDLVLSGAKKPRHAFLALPEDLQDQVIEGLDSGALTLQSASDLVKTSTGQSLSHEAIAGYYRAVRRERRLFDLRTEIARIVTEFSDGDTQANLKAAINLVLTTAIQGLADGEVGIKDIDLARMLALMPAPKPPAGEGEVPAAGGLSEDMAEKIRKSILGVGQ